MKTCTRCKHEKATSEFPSNVRAKDGLSSWCRQCQAEASKARRDAMDPEVLAAMMRKTHLKQKYGITVEDYDALLETQNGVCAICDGECATGRRLGVDHDHETDAVRGLLCHSCNAAIGLLRDDVKLLMRAIDYLERN